MPGRAISFAVGSQYGRRSDKWTIYVSDESDYPLVVAFCDTFRADWQFHWHLPDVWQIKQMENANARVLDDEGHPIRYPLIGGPSVGTVDQAKTDSICALHILIPDQCLTRFADTERSLPEKWLWVPQNAGGAMHFSLALCAAVTSEDSRPPSGYGDSARVITSIALADHSRLALIASQWGEIPAKLRSLLNKLPRSDQVLDRRERRAVATDRLADGSIACIEHAIDG